MELNKIDQRSIKNKIKLQKSTIRKIIYRPSSYTSLEKRRLPAPLHASDQPSFC